MNQENSLFEETNQNTIAICEKIYVVKNHMVDELNFIVDQAIKSAKMEVAISKIEGVPFERLSSLAKQVARNPSFKQSKKFEIVDIIEDMIEAGKTSEESKDDEIMVEIVEETQPQNENKESIQTTTVPEEIVDVPAEVERKSASKPSSPKRKWTVLQTIKTEDCELRFEVARLTKNDEKALSR